MERYRWASGAPSRPTCPGLASGLGGDRPLATPQPPPATRPGLGFRFWVSGSRAPPSGTATSSKLTLRVLQSGKRPPEKGTLRLKISRLGKRQMLLPAEVEGRVKSQFFNVCFAFFLKKFFKILFDIRVYLIYNVVLVSSVRQSDSFIHIHISILFQMLFPCSLLQNIEFPVLYRRSLLIIYFMYSSVYLLIPNS